MTDLMKLLCGRTCAGDARARGTQIQSTCKLCRESHKTQVWLCFLVLSLLSTSSMTETDELQKCIKNLTGHLKKSDAMLYAPSISDIKESCKKMSLECYLSELRMVVVEEAIPDNLTDRIHYVDRTPLDDPRLDGGCLPCEAHPLENITIFMDRLTHLLEEITAAEKQQNDFTNTDEA